jgi:LysM repeat protein
MARRTPARFLAPIALVAFAVALYMVISHGTQLGSGSSSSAGQQRTASPRGAAARTARRKARHRRRIYVVRAGDTPSGIAAKTGVSLAVLQRLNPKLDPQTLAPGQRIRLRR